MPCPVRSVAPRGVDAFALRRGHTSATWLVALEHPPPVAVLAGRTAEALMQWLPAHPAVTIFVHIPKAATSRLSRSPRNIKIGLWSPAQERESISANA